MIIAGKRPALIYPAGRRPGFNPRHIAGGRPLFSAVSTGARVISLFQGASPGAVGGTSITATIDSVIGPSIVLPNAATSASAANNFAGNLAAAVTSSTIAAIVRFNTIASNQCIFSNSSNSTGVALSITSTGLLQWVMFGVVAENSTITLAAGVPYFIVASQFGTTVINYLVKRLDNGVTITSTSASATPGATPNGTFVVGNSPATGSPADGRIAAVMFSAIPLSLPALRMWSNDPWSYWYPA